MPGEMSDLTAPNRNLDQLNALMIRSSSESQHEPLPCPCPCLLPPHDAEPDFDASGPVEAERMLYPPKKWNITNKLDAYAQYTHVPHFGQCTNGNTSDGFGLPVLHAAVARSEQRT